VSLWGRVSAGAVRGAAVWCRCAACKRSCPRCLSQAPAVPGMLVRRESVDACCAAHCTPPLWPRHHSQHEALTHAPRPRQSVEPRGYPWARGGTPQDEALTPHGSVPHPEALFSLLCHSTVGHPVLPLTWPCSKSPPPCIAHGRLPRSLYCNACLRAECSALRLLCVCVRCQLSRAHRPCATVTINCGEINCRAHLFTHRQQRLPSVHRHTYQIRPRMTLD